MRINDKIISPSRAWLQLNALLVLACLLTCLLLPLALSLELSLELFLELSLEPPEPPWTLYNGARTHFQCSFEECAGRTDARTHDIASPWAPCRSQKKITYSIHFNVQNKHTGYRFLFTHLYKTRKIPHSMRPNTSIGNKFVSHWSQAQRDY